MAYSKREERALEHLKEILESELEGVEIRERQSEIKFEDPLSFDKFLQAHRIEQITIIGRIRIPIEIPNGHDKTTNHSGYHPDEWTVCIKGPAETEFINSQRTNPAYKLHYQDP